MKKVLSIILSLCMLLSITAGLDFSAYALSYSGKCGDNVTYKYTASTETLTISGTGPMYDWNYYYEDFSPLTILYDDLDQNGKEITNVIIESGVTTIGDSAFYNMDIESVQIPDTIKTIGECAFFWNTDRLDNVVVPASVEKIGIAAFNQCWNLNNISLPSGIKEIGRYAFYNTAYTMSSRNIVDHCYYINDYLVKVDWCIYDDDEDDFDDYDDEDYVDTIKIKAGTKLISDWAFMEDFPHDDELEYKITVPDSVKYIGEYNFSPFYSFTVKYNGTNSNWNKINIHQSNSAHKLVCSDKTTYDHIADYEDRTPATFDKNGKVVKFCRCGKTMGTDVIYKATAKLSTTSYSYDGKVKKPTVIVKDSNGKAISSDEYTVTYDSGRKNVGKYKVTVNLNGDYYNGSKTLYFTIKPKSTTISKVSAAKKGFTVKWKKQTTQTTGYQIQYSTGSKFTSPKTVTVSKASTTSKKISKLKRKKKYYVRIRTYKTVNGTKYYSAWSKAKSVKTK